MTQNHAVVSRQMAKHATYWPKSKPLTHNPIAISLQAQERYNTVVIHRSKFSILLTKLIKEALQLNVYHLMNLLKEKV